MSENAIARISTSMPIPAPVSETAAILAVIERAARDPSVDLDKLERLLAMRDSMERRAEERTFAQAMSAAQAEMRRIATDSDNPATRSRYASYATLDRALRPIYTKHGLALSFDTADSPRPESIRVVCDVLCGGYRRQYHIDMPADGAGAKGGQVMTRTHATGSAATYGRRYLLMLIFNIAIGNDDDDDGNAAGGSPRNGHITAEQAEVINDLLGVTKANKALFLTYIGAKSIETIPAAKYETALAALRKKAQANAAAQ